MSSVEGRNVQDKNFSSSARLYLQAANKCEIAADRLHDCYNIKARMHQATKGNLNV